MRALLLSDYKTLREGHFSASSANSMSETVSLMHQRR